MPEKTKKKVTDTAKTEKTAKGEETVFVCKFCGETKPLSELVVLRQYYPLISCCKKCAKTTKSST